jgi:predicted negative regulator of RcsB-dependent stress response
VKRLKRKQLKEDELVSTVNKIIRFFKARTKAFVALVVLIAAFLLIFAGLKLVTGENRKKESRLLTQIIDLHAELNNNPENVARLEELAGDGKFSRLAYLLLATYCMENGDQDKAQSYLEKMPERRKDILYYQAKDLLAQIHFKRKNYDKAIEIYKKIILWMLSFFIEQRSMRKKENLRRLWFSIRKFRRNLLRRFTVMTQLKKLEN